MPKAKEHLLTLLDAEDFSELTREYASWLLSEISSPIWLMRFQSSQLSVNWKIKLGKFFLTDPEHAKLLKTFKSWLLIQTHPLCCERSPAQGQVAYNKVTQALRQIDYMLLHAEEWGLSVHGLSAVTENDVLNMLMNFEQHSADEEIVYEWNRCLGEYLAEEGRALSEKSLETALLQQPQISRVELPEEEWKLALTRDELIRARAYLWLNKLYKREKRLGYEYTPRTAIIADEIYNNTLWGQSKKSIHEELCLIRFETLIREYKGVPVQTSVGDGASEQSFRLRKNTLSTLPLLARFGCEVPGTAIKRAIESWTTAVENLRSPGRFRPAPFYQVIDTFRNATEFALNHGDHLVISYHNVLSAALAAGVSVASFVLEHDVRD